MLADGGQVGVVDTGVACHHPVAMTSSFGFLDHPGEMAARIRAIDWSAHPLGVPESWPQALRFALDLCLASSYPTAIYWGEPLWLLYNDAWAPIPADRHPGALARPAREVWHDIWDVVGPQFESVMASGIGHASYDQLLRMERDGVPRETYWTYSFTPIRDEHGRIAGVLNHGNETTRLVLAERVQTAEITRLRELFAQTPAAAALVIGPEHVHELANPGYRELVGRDQLEGRPVAEVMPELVEQGYVELLDRVWATGQAYRGEGRSVWVHRAGQDTPEERLVDFAFQPFRDAGGTMVGVLIQVVDITERARAEMALRASEDRLKLALDSSSGLGTWDWDLTTGLVVSDARFAQLYGMSGAESARGIDVNAFFPAIHPDDLPRVSAAIEESLTTGAPYDVEYRVVRDAGDVRWIAVQGRVTYAPDGSPLRFAGISFDITRRYEAEERARAAVETLHATTETQSFIYRLADRQRRLETPEAVMRETAEALAAQLGLDRAGFFQVRENRMVFGPCWTSGALPPTQGSVPVDRLGETILNRYRSGQTILSRDAREDPDFQGTIGSWTVVSGIGVPLLRAGEWVASLHVGSATPRDWSADEIALVEAVAEITWDAVGRLAALSALRESEAKFRAITNSVDQMIWSTRPDGYHDYFNDRWYEYTGVPYGSTDGELWNGIFHPEDQARSIAAWSHSLATGEPYHIEYRLRHVSGVYRWVLGRAQPVRDDQGRITRWFGTCTDIQEIVDAREVLSRSRVELEHAVEARTRELLAAQDQLRQAQKMEAVGQLTGGIAHDFNNMLAVVIGALDLLERRMARGERDITRYVVAARDGAERAAALVRRLLAFSRRSTLEPRTIDVNAMVRGMIDLLNRTLGESVQVETWLAADLGNARVDPGQLENAILNLGVNARDAMPRGGRLTIATVNRQLSQDQAARLGVDAGDYVEIAVSDSGMGMPPAVLERAFDPFFTTKDVGKGTGLGLSQVFGFVRQSGGHVTIDSAENQGTTVRMLLPLDRGNADPGIDLVKSEDTPVGRGEHILVVEDEARVRAYSCEALRELGYVVHEAASADAALALLGQGQPVDLLFTDVVMPGMLGTELAAAARRHRPGLAVLFTSGHVRDAAAADLPGIPGVTTTELLVKPFTVDALARRVRAALDSPSPRVMAVDDRAASH